MVIPKRVTDSLLVIMVTAPATENAITKILRPSSAIYVPFSGDFWLDAEVLLSGSISFFAVVIF